MNKYCRNTLHQIQVAVTTLIEVMDTLEKEDLHKRPTLDKYSVGELLNHITTICSADMLISTGASQEQIQNFYAEVTYSSLAEMKVALMKNYYVLQKHYSNLTEDELFTKSSSYWGVTYTKYEWLLEILAHLYHHRGQLHAILVHCYQLDPKVALFE
ncbi:DinB family protein [Bacillus sp. AGMB 02131]|uniref:DinB family protein n=2 Tax=Peribacillus faecalis TaxID=2772559 RepID=A0A927CYC0_9BACI|nr:DinB family protein [Peribacillus faecalis]